MATPRITGDNPPLHLWDKYPNWENAWDEEGAEGQDETTLRPSANQSMIDEDVSFAAGQAELGNGEMKPALIALVAEEIDSVYVYPNPREDKCWDIFPLESGEWKANVAVEALGSLPAPLDQKGLLPIRVTSRMPLKGTRKKIDVTISRLLPPGRQP
jgi:hypothetical protein